MNGEENKSITDKAKEAITGRLAEVGQTVANNPQVQGVGEAISKASKDTSDMGDSLLNGIKSSYNENSTEEPQQLPSPSGVTGGRKRRRKSRKSRRRKSRKSRRSRRRKSKRKTRRRRKRRNRK